MGDTTSRDRMKAALNEKPRVHPLVSAVQFMHQTNQKVPGGTQGASLDVGSGRMYNAGDSDVWMVGGHRDNAGKRIKSKNIKGNGISLLQAVNHVQNVKRLTAGQKQPVAAGSWYSEEKDHTALDASSAVDSREDAVSMMKHRGEDAIFNLRTFEEVANPNKKR